LQLETKALRWKEYFVNLSSCAIPNNLIPHTEYQRADLHIESLYLENVEAAILRLKNWKVPGTGDITTELI